MTSPIRVCALVALVAALTAGGSEARAQQGADCASKAEDAQTFRAERKLLRARAALVECAQSTCPTVVRSDCTGWLREVEAELPTLVVRAVDAKGNDLTDVRVELDGRLLVDHLDGSALSLDPGEVTLRLTATGMAPKDVKLVVAQGEKARNVRVVLDAPGSPAPVAPRADEAAPSSRAPWVFLGVGVASLAAFGVLQGLGQSQYSDLEDGCGRTRSCTDDDVSPVRTKFVVSGIALAVGAVGLGAAATWWIVSPSSPGAPAAAVRVGPLGAQVHAVF